MRSKLFSNSIIEKLFDAFVDSARLAAAAIDLPLDEVSVSASEFVRAISDAELDLEHSADLYLGGEDNYFHGNRRSYSLARIAGCIAFRLNRYRTLQILSDRQDIAASKFQELVIVFFAFHVLVKEEPPQRLLAELTYALKARDINQEALSLIFQTVVDLRGGDKAHVFKEHF
ncbi:hypothetical protein [Azospirillum palustre]